MNLGGECEREHVNLTTEIMEPTEMIKTNSNESKQISKNENNAHSTIRNTQCGLRVVERTNSTSDQNILQSAIRNCRLRVVEHKTHRKVNTFLQSVIVGCECVKCTYLNC